MTTHNGYIESGMADETYLAGCSCGWASEWRAVMAQAEADLDQHYKDLKGAE